MYHDVVPLMATKGILEEFSRAFVTYGLNFNTQAEEPILAFIFGL